MDTGRSARRVPLRARAGRHASLLGIAAVLAPRGAWASETQSILNEFFREVALYVGGAVLVVVALIVLKRLIGRWRERRAGGEPRA